MAQIAGHCSSYGGEIDAEHNDSLPKESLLSQVALVD